MRHDAAKKAEQKEEQGFSKQRVVVSKWEENPETPTPARRSENRGNEGTRGRA